MRRSDDPITLEWCEKHKCWGAPDCAECMADQVAEEKNSEITGLRDNIKRLEQQISDLENTLPR